MWANGRLCAVNSRGTATKTKGGRTRVAKGMDTCTRQIGSWGYGTRLVGQTYYPTLTHQQVSSSQQTKGVAAVAVIVGASL
jgi:hypothetical protein